ncbi:MAG: anion permease [Pseudomonadales bacterium]
MALNWHAVAPVAIAAGLAMVPAPEGLDQHAWYFFAVFTGVIVALVFEPLPGGAVGLIGVTLIATLSPWTLFSPSELSRPDFEPTLAAIRWGLSGFSNSTVWLIFGAFMFAMGYDRTGLGKRIALLLVRAMGRRTLTLGYAVTIADTLLAPFTPSSTARSGGTIYPVIRNLPPLYDSHPNDPSMRRVGSYLMWVAIASTCVTSSLFLTALAPNLLAAELVNKTVGVELGWLDWFVAAAPFGILLLVLLPLLVYWIYPPEVKEGSEVPAWAAGELAKMGPLSRREITLGVLVVIALLLWIFGAGFVDATTAALVVISLMLLLGVVSWDDITSNRAAWNTLAWFATLVALADGLTRVGFVTWFAQSVATGLHGVTPAIAVAMLLAINFFGHYLFASITAHVTAMIPVLLAVASTIPGVNLPLLSLGLCLQLGIMGIISPFATGSSPVYYGSGYLPAADYWRLGAIFGGIFFGVFLLVGVPWMLTVG